MASRGNAPPAGPPPGPAGPPPPPYPAYPPYPYPYPYYPPPKKDNTVPIVVIVLILVLVVPVILAAVLYVMVSGLIAVPDPGGPPIVLGPAQLVGGNATVPVASISTGVPPAGVRFSLAVDGLLSTTRDLPPPDGSVLLILGNYTIRVFWLNDFDDGLVGRGDEFLFTGDLAPLPAASDFEFSLISAEGGFGATASWSTP